MSSSVSETSRRTAAAPAVACFTISAAVSPGVMPRVLDLFAKRGAVPTEWRSRAADDHLTIDIRMHGMDRSLGDYIGRCLRQVYLVERVLVTHDAAGDDAGDGAQSA